MVKSMWALSSTRQVAQVSAFAALIVIVTRLPGIPIAGTAGQIKLSLLLYPLAGIMLGAGPGAVAVLIGNLVSWLIPPASILGLLLVIPGVVATATSGLLSWNEGRKWKVAAFLMLLLNLLWYATMVGREAPLYPALHWFAFVIIIIFRRKICEMIESKARNQMLSGALCCSYVAVLADGMTGNLLFILAVGWVVPLKSALDAVATLGMIWVRLGIPGVPLSGLSGLFMGVFVVMVFERVVATIASALLCVAVLRIVGRYGSGQHKA